MGDAPQLAWQCLIQGPKRYRNIKLEAESNAGKKCNKYFHVGTLILNGTLVQEINRHLYCYCSYVPTSPSYTLPVYIGASGTASV